MTSYQSDAAGVLAACSLVGDRWSLPVVAALLGGPLRYGEISERVSGIAPNVLSARLRSLERDGLVQAQAYSQRPLRFAYRLTDDGSRLAESIEALSTWARAREGGEIPRHESCGTALERRWWCPACDAAVGRAGEDDEAISV